MEKTIFIILIILVSVFFTWFICTLMYWFDIFTPKMSTFQTDVRKNDYSSLNYIPKRIWTYWHSTNIPPIVKKCINTWKKYNPFYEITVLNKKNIKKYITISDDILEHPIYNDSHARFADLIRFCVLAENGGLWLDSTIILTENVDKWLFNKEAEFAGFYLEQFTTNHTFPIIESWFLACNKNSELMIRWRDEFLTMMHYPNAKEYVESRKKIGVDIQGINIPYYLACHISLQKVLQIDKYPIDKCVLYKAEDGPFKYLKDANWNSVIGLFEANKHQMYTYPILKMRGGERFITNIALKTFHLSIFDS